MATTPLQGWTVPAGSQAPATAADMAALGGAAEKQAVMVYATTAAMDTAIPTANRKAGMIAWIANLGRRCRWAPPSGGAPPGASPGRVVRRSSSPLSLRLVGGFERSATAWS